MRKASSKDEYNYYSVFPTRLRGLLGQANIKQDDLASFCSVRRQSVAQWKDGNTRPDILSLRKIAEFFKVSTDYLLGISDNPTNDKDLNAVCEYIGLEQNATKKIKAISQKKTLSAILESDYFSKYVEALEDNALAIKDRVFANLIVDSVSAQGGLIKSGTDFDKLSPQTKAALKALSKNDFSLLYKQIALDNVQKIFDEVTDKLCEDGASHG